MRLIALVVLLLMVGCSSAPMTPAGFKRCVFIHNTEACKFIYLEQKKNPDIDGEETPDEPMIPDEQAVRQMKRAVEQVRWDMEFKVRHMEFEERSKALAKSGCEFVHGADSIHCR